MLTPIEAIHEIRDIATSWLQPTGDDGATCMNRVTSLLLDTGFTDPQVFALDSSKFSPQDITALKEAFAAAKGGSPVVIEPQRMTYDGIADPDLLVRLQARIDDAEHKPGQWAETRQSMGGICTHTGPFDIGNAFVREDQWASFSYKRDGFLAVAAVNALPELISTIRDLQGQLEAAKALGVDACDTIIDSKVKQTAAERDVLAERVRQVTEEGFGTAHDDEGPVNALVNAAACYLQTDSYPNAGQPPPAWPWNHSYWKPKDYRRDLVRAAALLIAEIERFDRSDLNQGLADAAMLQAGFAPLDDGEQSLPAGLTWSQAPAWADRLGRAYGNSLFWFSVAMNRYRYVLSGGEHAFTDGVDAMGGTHALSEVTLVASRTALADDGWIEWLGNNWQGPEGLRSGDMVWVRLEDVEGVRPGVAGRWDWRATPAMGRSRIVAYRLTPPSLS